LKDAIAPGENEAKTVKGVAVFREADEGDLPELSWQLGMYR